MPCHLDRHVDAVAGMEIRIELLVEYRQQRRHRTIGHHAFGQRQHQREPRTLRTAIVGTIQQHFVMPHGTAVRLTMAGSHEFGTVRPHRPLAANDPQSEAPENYAAAPVETLVEQARYRILRGGIAAPIFPSIDMRTLDTTFEDFADVV